MYQQLSRSNKKLLFSISIIAWLAVIFQLYLALKNTKLSMPGTIIQFFSYFTILTNILVAVCCTIILLKQSSRAGKFFIHPSVLTAITLYIFIVGLVYNVILRFTWAPQGLQKIVDETLHTLIPILFILYWIYFVPKNTLQWKNIFGWMAYPLIYCLYILIRGQLTNLYPYPFMDVAKLGYKTVLTNCAYLVIVFLLGALILLAIAKFTTRNYHKTLAIQ